MMNAGCQQVKFSFAIVLGLLSPDVAEAQPGDSYAPWVPGDAGLYIDQKDQAWSACISRDPCPKK